MEDQHAQDGLHGVEAARSPGIGFLDAVIQLCRLEADQFQASGFLAHGFGHAGVWQGGRDISKDRFMPAFINM